MNIKLASALLIVASTLSAQYKVEPAETAPAGLPASLASAVEKKGVKITGPKGTLCELWFRSTPTPPSNLKEDTSTWTGVAHGTFIGVIHFPTKHADRRGNPINPGTYTLRLSFFPVNGDHQGVAPQRDFLILTKSEEDSDPNAATAYEPLMVASKKVTGSPHPAVLSMWKVESDFKEGFEKMGENDYVLQIKVAGTPIAIILIGKAEG